MAPRWRLATAGSFVALAVAACMPEAPARPNGFSDGTLGDLGTPGDSDGTDGATANGEASSSDAFPPADMSGSLPGESSSGGESSTSAGDTSDAALGCNIYAQDCPAGEKCTIWVSQAGGLPDAARCVPVAEQVGQAGDLCQVMVPFGGEDDCAAGSFCRPGLDGEAAGVCTPYCVGGPEEPLCADPNTTCGLLFGGVAPVCLYLCYLGEDGCLAGQRCLALTSNMEMEADLGVCVEEGWVE